MSDSITKIMSGISEQVGSFLPNVAAAIGVLIVGWIIAKLLARVAKLAIQKTGLDDRMAHVLGTHKQTDVAGLLSKVVYYIAMLFVFVTFFNVLDLPVVSQPLSKFLDSIFEFAPHAISAIVLGIIAWGLATVARLASRKGLETLDIDGKIAAIGQDAQTVTGTARSAVSSALPHETSAAGNQGEALLEISGESELMPENELLEAEPVAAVETVADFSESDQMISGAGDSSSQNNLRAPVVGTPAGTTIANGTAGEASLAKSLPEAVYWLILFLFLPAILGALQMPGLLEPVQGMFEKALEYLPNMLGAAVILAVGISVAKIVRQVVTNLTASFGVDRLGERVGIMPTEGGTRLSGILGILAYATVLLPIVVAALNTLAIEAVTRPASAVLEQITHAIPGLIGGVVVLGISFFVAKLIGGIVTDLLSGVGFDDTVKKMGLIRETATTQSPSSLAGKVLMVVIMVLATMQALPIMGLERFADHLDQFVVFATQVAVGLVVIGLGIYLANIAAKFIRETGVQGGDKLATVARVAIMIFAGAMGLERMGLSSSIVNVAFGTLLGGLGLAAAIAFGWGGRDAAKRLVDRYVS